ncbi:MAG: Gfo/Idh/MocA family oxidoreductase [Bacteroidota bacterium]
MAIRLGLFGAGHLGKIHLKLLKEIPDFELVGFFDTDPSVRESVAADMDVPAFSDQASLLAEIEAADIVTPTPSHFGLAEAALKRGLHVFMEKPATETVEEAQALLALLEERADLVAQVGHVERFNPAFLAVKDRGLKPMFIEGHRLAQYNPRGTDVSVVHDLMIHDLDVILSLVDAPVSAVSASGVAVVSDTPDIANARIEFTNGCVANLTASRISMKNMRRLRMFQKNRYLAVDFLKKQAEILHLSDTDDGAAEPGKLKMAFEKGEGSRYLIFEQPTVEAVNAIKMELESFATAIRGEAAVPVSLQDGYKALVLAERIREEMQLRQDAYDQQHKV